MKPRLAARLFAAGQDVGIARKLRQEALELLLALKLREGVRDEVGMRDPAAVVADGELVGLVGGDFAVCFARSSGVFPGVKADMPPIA